MKNKTVLIILFVFIIISCYKNDSNVLDYTKGFINYKWGTKSTQIINDLGKPQLIQTFPQYGTEVKYYHFGNMIEYGYNTIYNYAFIENELVGGGYWIISPNDENIEYITGTEDAYNDLQKKLNQLFGEPSTSSDFLDSVWNKNMKIPENTDDLSDEEFIALLPFQTFWNIGQSLIKLSLNYDDFYILKLDIMGPKIVKLADIELGEQLNKLLEEYK